MPNARNGRARKKVFRNVGASVQEPNGKDGVLRIDEQGEIKSYRPIVREFVDEATGTKYMYCYEKTDLPAIQNAETVFRYREDQVEHPPINLRLLEESCGGQYMIEAFQHLLMRVNPDGSIEPYDEIKARTITRKFITQTLKGKDWNALRECRRDFFTMAELQDNESLMRLVNSRKSAAELAETQLRIMQAAINIGNNSKELHESTKAESLNEELEKSEKTDLHGSSQDMIQSELSKSES